MTEENLHLALSPDQLQELVDAVALCAGEKRKYEVKIGRTRTCAHTYHYHKTGRRIIQFSRDSLHDYTRNLIKTTIHEIVHFKECERGRKKLLQNEFVSNPAKLFVPEPIFRQTYGYTRHKWHTKKFNRIYENLKARVEKEYGEPL